MIPPPPTSTPSPYTTLSRSHPEPAAPQRRLAHSGGDRTYRARRRCRQPCFERAFLPRTLRLAGLAAAPSRHRRQSYLLSLRSEEHTSELQSRQYLVCRLLLE